MNFGESEQDAADLRLFAERIWLEGLFKQRAGSLCVVVACGICKNQKRLGEARWIPYQGRVRLGFGAPIALSTEQEVVLRRVALGDDDELLIEWAAETKDTPERLRREKSRYAGRVKVTPKLDFHLLDGPYPDAEVSVQCVKCGTADVREMVTEAAAAPSLRGGPRWIRFHRADLR
jgi:hypothetical protein